MMRVPRQGECITHYIGGGFGSKFGRTSRVACRGAGSQARRAGQADVDRPRDRAGGNRPSTSGKVKLGAKKDGTIVAFRGDAYSTPGIGFPAAS